MAKLVGVVWFLAAMQFAHAEVEARTYKSVGDVVYMPQDDVPSCGKASRDLIKAAAKEIQTVSIGTRTVQMNNGKPWEITAREEDSLIASERRKDPVSGHPNRVVSFSALVVRTSPDDHIFAIMRTATSGNQSCSDAYRMSIE